MKTLYPILSMYVPLLLSFQVSKPFLFVHSVPAFACDYLFNGVKTK
jgi:hypothetical protein